jgi:hypothetical protein
MLANWSHSTLASYCCQTPLAMMTMLCVLVDEISVSMPAHQHDYRLSTVNDYKERKWQQEILERQVVRTLLAVPLYDCSVDGTAMSTDGAGCQRGGAAALTTSVVAQMTMV